MHLQEAEIAAFVHGEMPASLRADVQRHIAGCADCAGRLERFRATDSLIASAFALLDHELPRVTADAIIARAKRRPFRASRAIAAGIAALVVAGTAAAAVPGSPVRQYVQRLLAGPPRPALAPPPAPVPRPAPSGVAFVPEGTVDVDFSDAQRSGVIRVTLSDSSTFRITHEGGRAGYALTADGVSVENAASAASYRITLPRSLAHARIRVGGRVVFAALGSRVETAAPRDSAGAYVIGFAAPGAEH